MAAMVIALMTRVVAAIGCCPQKLLALVVVGGMLVAPVLILIVLALMIDLFSRRLGPGIELPHWNPQMSWWMSKRA